LGIKVNNKVKVKLKVKAKGQYLVEAKFMNQVKTIFEKKENVSLNLRRAIIFSGLY